MKHIWPITIDELTNYKRIDELLVSAFEILKPRKGKYFLMGVESACFAEITKEAALYLEYLKSSGAQYLPLDNQIDEELYMLAANGFFNSRNNVCDGKKIETVTLNINITTHCNLKCRYCFAEEGTYGMQHQNVCMDTINDAIKMMVNNASEVRVFNVVIFGGEPLTEPEIVRKTIRLCNEYENMYGIIIRLDIFTNATLIPEWLFEEFRVNKNIRFLVSIDGAPEVNQFFRKSANGKNYTDVLERNIKRLMQIDSKRVVMRATVSTKKADIVGKAQYYVNLGAKNIVFESALCSDMPDIDKASDIYNEIYEELEAVKQLLKTYILGKTGININLISETTAIILGKNRGNYIPECPAGKNYMSISIDGDIYPCHYLNCNNDFKLGSLSEGVLPQKDILRENKYRSLDKKETICKKCIYRSSCSGLCPYKSLVMYKDDNEFTHASCKLWEKRILKSLELVSEVYSLHNYPAVSWWKQREEENGEI